MSKPSLHGGRQTGGSAMDQNDLRKMVARNPRASAAVERQLGTPAKSATFAQEPRGGPSSTSGGASGASGGLPGASRRVLRLVLSLPPRELSPNARCCWQAKARAVKAYRRAAYYGALGAWNAILEPMGSAVLNLHFFFGRAGRHDSDNLVASFKPARDGLADEGIVCDDKDFRIGTVAVGVCKKNPRVEVEIVEADDLERAIKGAMTQDPQP